MTSPTPDDLAKLQQITEKVIEEHQEQEADAAMLRAENERLKKQAEVDVPVPENVPE